MTGTALHFTLRRMQDLFRRPATLVTLVAVIVALGVSGPFGTMAQFSIGPRFAYWTVIVFATFSVGYFCGTFATRLLTPGDAYYLAVPLAGVTSGVPVTLVVLAVNAFAYPALGFDSGSAFSLLFSCVAVSTGVTAVFAAFRKAPETARAAAANPAPRLLERLPVTARGALVSLSVSDHYVEVVTARGKALLLMRLSDAITETDGVAGVQIHRSHWVALAGVRQVHKSGGRVTVETSAGDRLPVSRGYQAAARDAGLIA